MRAISSAAARCRKRPFTNSTSSARRTGQRWQRATSRGRTTNSATAHGRASCTKRSSTARAVGNTHLVAVSLASLGGYAAAERRVEEAVPLLTESTRILLELGDRGFLGANLGRLA